MSKRRLPPSQRRKPAVPEQPIWPMVRRDGRDVPLVRCVPVPTGLLRAAKASPMVTTVLLAIIALLDEQKPDSMEGALSLDDISAESEATLKQAASSLAFLREKEFLATDDVVHDESGNIDPSSPFYVRLLYPPFEGFPDPPPER